MEQRDQSTDNPETSPGSGIEGVGPDPGGDKSAEPDRDDATEESKADIVIKQVPVDGICGGY
jgi:hypothetical protein